MIQNGLRVLTTLIVFMVLCGSASAATFAQFTMSPADNLFIFNSLGPNSATLTANNVAVNFQYSGVAGLPAGLQGVLAANVTVNMQTNSNASQIVIPPTFNVQPFTGFVNSISIDLDTPYNGMTNLLTTSIGGGTLSGTEGGTAAAFSASSSAAGESVLFSSDFLSFAGTTNRGVSLAFTSVNPGLAYLGATLPLSDFDAAAIATFAADPTPFVPVPEPLAGMLVGFGLVAIGVHRRRMTAKK